MGCMASKLDNEGTVRRCKERHRLMKEAEAVYARHHLAAAHSDYLRLTGFAFLDFASGEPLSVSDQTSVILLRNTSSLSSSSSYRATTPLPSQPPPPPARTTSSITTTSSRPPPLPQQYYSPSSPTIASSNLPHIARYSQSGMYAECLKMYERISELLREMQEANGEQFDHRIDE